MKTTPGYPPAILKKAVTIFNRLLLYRGFTCMKGVESLADIDIIEAWKEWYQEKTIEGYGFDIDPIPGELNGVQTEVSVMVEHYQGLLMGLIDEIHAAVLEGVRNKDPLFDYGTIRSLGGFVFSAYSDLAIEHYYTLAALKRESGEEPSQEEMMMGIPMHAGVLPPFIMEDGKTQKPKLPDNTQTKIYKTDGYVSEKHVAWIKPQSDKPHEVIVLSKDGEWFHKIETKWQRGVNPRTADAIRIDTQNKSGWFELKYGELHYSDASDALRSKDEE